MLAPHPYFLSEAALRVFLLFMALALPAHAADATASSLAAEMEGVYKHKVRTGTVLPEPSPEAYISEDIVEIVRYDATHVYVRAELNFFNGHKCSIAGMAGYENQSFVFHDPAPSYDNGPQCTFTVRQTKDAITFTDRLTPDGVSSCSDYCGVRGSLTGSMARKSKRPIRYMDLLKRSRQYLKAIENLRQYEASQAATGGPKMSGQKQLEVSKN